ncbi:MAG: SRPBCC domain-containing protein [Oligoflexus sp.]
MTAACKANEIRLIRVYEASVVEVWEAWTDPNQAAMWWGPRGFTLTTHSKDLRVGGNWKYTMHGPDGTDYPNNTIYHELEPYKRLVYDHGGNDDQPPLFRVTVTFNEVDGKTVMDMVFALDTAETAEQMRQFIKSAGGNATWDRLAEYLAKKKEDKDVFVINHSFAAPPETVFAMWTDPMHLRSWLPPKGFSMEFLRSEIKEGASTFYRMFNKGGIELYGRTHYLQISPSRQIVMKQDFCDQHENMSRHPLAPELPQSILTTVQFVAEGDGVRVTLTSVSGNGATAKEIARFVEERAGMSQGWGGSLDALEEKLH